MSPIHGSSSDELIYTPRLKSGTWKPNSKIESCRGVMGHATHPASICLFNVCFSSVHFFFTACRYQSRHVQTVLLCRHCIHSIDYRCFLKKLTTLILLLTPTRGFQTPCMRIKHGILYLHCNTAFTAPESQT